ncbi:alpha/beta fold hydrolase [Streptomyces radicis]|uniref:Alpha/beta fold hydrolase n=1 Tax=Streptomyces radicis TaxID=1750517 RepID=A0A3A9WTE8_9ACTN|nr:alpha/beta fold hydrolase [Streptomyces radicis]RKN12804.1 alpha/beta fold hydrolase [Streptomyces radicis]RKN27431.1 alpha/beta fold hydrolase [Streptomyces radicis]
MIKRYVDSRHGQLHVVESGAGRPVLFLHQTPRSWDEYRDVLPLVAPHARALAMDTVGFGESARPTAAFSVEMFADGVEDVLDALSLRRVVLVGHHTGGVIAVEVAARRPDLVHGLVLSGTPYVSAERRARVALAPPIDLVEVEDDGSHLAELWARRRDFYPRERPDLLNRLVADALRVIDRVEEGHEAVNRYRMEERVSAVEAATLILCGELDGYSLPDVPRLERRLAHARSLIIPGTGVAAVDHRPQDFARAVLDFVRELDRPGS